MTLPNALRLIPVLVLLLQAGNALADDEESSVTPCGPLHPYGQYGPYDFRNAGKDKTEVVVAHHFNADVEALRSGVKYKNDVGGDLDYTLRALPNHPRALVAMMRLGDRESTDQPRGAHYTVNCYFERALRFRPDDYIVRLIYAGYLINKKRVGEAVSQIDYVAATAPTDNPLTHYNLALLYLDAGQYTKSQEQGLKAEAQGKNIEQLRSRLAAVAPAASAPEAPASAASDAGPQ